MNSTPKEKTSKIFIIGIGASAGGMHPVHCLFNKTPDEGVAYVIVQHVSPDHESFRKELLSRHSNLKISDAKNGMYVEPNQIYLIPKGMNMTIKDRRLLRTDRIARQPNAAIDIFLDSLAADQGDKSIAVILSGTGTDGTKGITAIKQNGGYVIVQDPESSEFDGMPRSAIESGNADAILAPEFIPDEIISFLNRVQLEDRISTEPSNNDEEALVRILELIKEHTPHDFTEYKRPTIIRRIANRMSKNEIETLSEYADFLKGNPAETEFLEKEFLISVTKFFRDKNSFDIIKEKVLPKIVENKLQADTLRLWVVGCATGEEAYSLAILVSEHLSEVNKNLEVKIFASDIDKTAIQHASKGIYSDKITEDVSEERIRRFFDKEDGKYHVKDSLRKMIIFADHDIVKNPPYGKIDLISCRNLLIYLNPLLQKKIISTFHFCLNSGGHLFLGPSESLGELNNFFDSVDMRRRIFRKIETSRNLRQPGNFTSGLEMPLINLNPIPAPKKNLQVSALSEHLYQALLDVSEYDAGICVDTDFEIILTLGDYEKYLLPKVLNFNLLEILPDELSIATATAVKKAIGSNDVATLREINFKRYETLHSVNVFAKPFFSERTSDQNVILVLFSQNVARENDEDQMEVFGLEELSSRYLQEIKSELADTKRKLGDVYQELNLSNDYISSFSEELISTNEELQSINEEYKSVNEELTSLNNEYQLKIKELADLNDDLNNFFKASVNARLFVDKDFVIRKFTPSAIQQVNLRESDIGRSLRDISTNIKFSTLMEDIQNVISSSATVKKEIQTNDGTWFQMIAMPYIKEKENINDGAIISFNDITELKRIQNKLSRINADHATFIYSASHDLNTPVASLAMVLSHLKMIVAPDEEVMEMIVMMEKSINNLIRILKELSDISRIESEIDKPENVAVEELLKEVEEGMLDCISKTNTKLILDLKVPEIPFSKKNLRSILSNLISNAIKYKSTDRPPEVIIRTVKSEEYIMMTVQDNGIGIPADKKKKIFGVFQRAHKHVEGTGVGLYLVKKTITNAGGDIEVESELGKGSTFTVYFKNEF